MARRAINHTLASMPKLPLMRFFMSAPCFKEQP